MTFKSTKYAKNMTDPKNYGLFENTKLPQLRYHCKYYKEKSQIVCPEIIGICWIGF